VKIIILILLLVCLIGCDRGAVRQVQESFENKAIKSVQQADSRMPGISCLDFIGRMTKIAESKNIQIKSKGWTAYQDQSRIVVVYAIDRKKERLQWKWCIENDEIIPINGLARGTAERQKVKM
jgi:hypothetical protein